jgi:hypothetical protein
MALLGALLLGATPPGSGSSVVVDVPPVTSGRTPLAVTYIVRAGVTATVQAGDPANGNSADNPDGRTVLLVRNTGGTTRTLTVQVRLKVDSQPVDPRVYTIPAGQARYLGGFAAGIYGTVLWLDPSSTELSFEVLRLT